MRKYLYNEKLLLIIILLNVGVIYFHTFDLFKPYYLLLDYLDVLFTGIFLCEISVKIYDQKGQNKLKYYLKDAWNKIDFFSVLLALPSVGVLFSHHFEYFAGFTALRTLRVFKFLRIIEYIPNGKRISKQVFKALKSISFIIFAFVVYSTIISIISVSLFKNVAPKYFHDAFDAFFTIFKIFSGDGFSDVVAEISNNCSGPFLYFTKFYFVFIVFTGSILGLSLINSIFIDQMTQMEEQIEEKERMAIEDVRSEIKTLQEQNRQLMEQVKILVNKKEM